MTAAERKQLQRAREADRARRREPLETKLQRAQMSAEQLLANAQDLGVKLAVERNVSITTRDIARYMIGLDGTDHVRAALEGKPVILPPARATETVTPSVTQQERQPLNVTSNVTNSLNVTSTVVDCLVCNFCRKKSGEVGHMLIFANRADRSVIAVCDECLKDCEEDATGVTDDVTDA
jgi:hypothetical protein